MLTASSFRSNIGSSSKAGITYQIADSIRAILSVALNKNLFVTFQTHRGFSRKALSPFIRYPRNLARLSSKLMASAMLLLNVSKTL
jgi:hypothetical protein